jgi:hypothetical protein
MLNLDYAVSLEENSDLSGDSTRQKQDPVDARVFCIRKSEASGG